MTHRPISLIAILSMLIVAHTFSLCTPVAADLIKLKNGGELRGSISGKRDVVASERIELTTLSGSRIVVTRDSVQFVTRRPHIVEVYETRANQTPSTIEAQWRLAEWCREQGVTLKQERKIHLQRVIQLDPEHKRAHAALKHTKHNGIWMTRDEERRAEGYVKYKGRYITPQELELIEKTEAELKAEQAWYRQVRLWKGWVTGRNQKRFNEGYTQLAGINDPYAVAALQQNFSDDDDPSLRQFYVKILDQIPGDTPVSPLVDRALFDSISEIRYQSINALAPEQYPAATRLFARQLDNDVNHVVRRAGRALARVGNEQVVPKLIDALITTHRYRVRVPVQGGSLSFGTDGSFGNSGQSLLTPEVEAMIRGGQFPNGVIVHNPSVNQLQRTKIVKVKYDHKNAEVLTSLQKLTGADFGYNKRNWRLWWTAKKNGATKVP